jgi:hypothetical protein
LIKDQDSFHAERDAVYEAGLRSSPWQHTDDTLTQIAIGWPITTLALSRRDAQLPLLRDAEI